MTKPTELYRFDSHQTCSVDEWDNIVGRRTHVNLQKYPIVKYTPKGYWISMWGDKKWVSAHARKRFAYPTKEEASFNFVKRKERHIKILKAQIRKSEEALRIHKGGGLFQI